MDTAVFPATSWPVLHRYDRDHLTKIALPVGGIGTGTISFGGRGDLRDFEIVNCPAKGFAPANTFFALWTKSADGTTTARVLEGPYDPFLYEGSDGAIAANAGLPRFREASFEATYPFGRVLLSDVAIPLRASVEAWNPLVPPDTERSGLPVAVIRVHLTNPGDQPIEASVAFALQNFIGDDGLHTLAKGGRITYRESEELRGLFYETNGVPADAETWGTMALTTADTDTSYRSAWARLSWNGSLLDFWDDFSADGVLEDRAVEGQEKPMGTLAVRRTVAARATETITFLLGWHFPNRQSWTPGGQALWRDKGGNEVGAPTIGNYYTTRFSDAWDAVTHTASDLPALEQGTLTFLNAFCSSDLPHVVKEAALFNLSTLRTQTLFRTPDGRYYGWEGCHDHHGSCHGSCTHVWNYEQTTAFLFGSIARSLRDTEFRYMTDHENGHMVFRVALPLEPYARAGGLAAADGQMGCLLKLHRDWKLCGDDAFLRDLWPAAKKALAFAWVPGGWDGDRDGVMEGCQHNTMDVEYYGPNPQMGALYLGALRSAEEMARYLGDTEFAEECHRLFASGSAWMDENLFNGDYYEHYIVPPAGESSIAPGLRHSGMGAADVFDPDLQLGAGCLIDQLWGQAFAHVCGLGYLLKPDHVRTTLQSILRYNHKEDFSDHFNNMRTYVYGNESATLMASYPKGRRPRRPFPYFTEVMTGFEYILAVGMLYEGQTEDALTVIRAIRERYEGQKRSPFDEAECGHHYARAMAAWGCVLALTGQHYDAHTATLTVHPLADSQNGRTDFWSIGDAYGTITQERTAGGEITKTVRVLAGPELLEQRLNIVAG